ncbi:MAG: lysozyme [Elusimicrobia bacterium]|nr:lysozyme [Elusimicrobiota bacterium]
MGGKFIALAVLLACASVPAGAVEFLSEPGVAAQLDAIRAGSLLLQTSRGRPPEGKPPIEDYPVRGFDVSHYQETIRWDKVKTEGYSFVFIKATEGDGYVDANFLNNWKGAEAAGLAKGAYHFWDFCLKGGDQADNFLRTVPVDAGAMAPTIDIEPSGSCSKRPAKAAFRKQLDDFIGKIEPAYGKMPILYVNGDIYRTYFEGDDLKYPIWFAYPREPAPKLPDGKNWTFWQYAFHGSVGGIDGEVDLDVFNGDKKQFADWIKNGGDSIGTLAAP